MTDGFNNLQPPQQFVPEGSAEDALLGEGSLFADIFGAFEGDETTEETPEAPTAGTPDQAVSGQPAAPAEGASAEPAPSGAPVAGDGGVSAVPLTVEPPTPIIPSERWGSLAESIETRSLESIRATVSAELESDYAKYIEALQEPARALVGREVPSFSNPGEMEILRDGADAKDWQEAAIHELRKEMEHRVNVAQQNSRSFMDTVQSTVQLFQKNQDLIPNTPTFNKDVLEKFYAAVKPYEYRQDGKLYGYTIDVQPFVDAARREVAFEARLAAPTPAPTPAPPAPKPAHHAATQPRTPQGTFAPQPGIPNGSGSAAPGDDDYDYDTLFGGIGLRGFRP